MTREERELSIEYLEGIKDNYIEGYGYERHPLPEYYAIENAVQALEQEPILDKLRAEIEPKCDRINSLASVLPYIAHREIQELLCEIMDLCEAEDGNNT